MSNDADLLKYNERGALAQVLAIEEHLQQLPQDASGSWCAKKHSLLAIDHHLSEAINHASRVSPGRAERYRALRARAQKVLGPALRGKLPNLGEVAQLRNAMRKAFKDPTLTESCAICAKDDSGLSGLGGATVNLKLKSAVKYGLVSGALGWFFGVDLPVAFGVGFGVRYLWEPPAPAPSLEGLGMHPGHPMHPYNNGAPAVWGGRRVLS